MLRFTLFLLPICFSFGLTKDESNPRPERTVRINKSFFRLGDRLITLEKCSGDQIGTYLIIALHNNEQTAISAATSFVADHKASFIRLVHNGSFNVEANVWDKTIRFDPDKIFTSWGRKMNLKNTGWYNKNTSQQVQEFAHFLVTEFSYAPVLVSVHNNEGNRSILEYRSGNLQRETKDYYINPLQDQSDFVITTDEKIFRKLKDKQINAIWQKKGKLKDNGSLNVYCVKVKKPYVHIEARSDHLEEQKKLLAAVDEILQ